MPERRQLGEANRTKILDALSARHAIPHFANLVEAARLADNSYHLSVQQYVQGEDAREEVDLAELSDRIARTVKRQQELRAVVDTIVADLADL